MIITSYQREKIEMTTNGSRKILSGIITVITLLVFAGCHDDLLYDRSIIGEGEAKVSFVMDFEPSLTSIGNTRAAGDAVNTIENVTVVAYNNDGSLYKVWRSSNGDFKFTVSSNDKMPGDVTLNPGNPPENGMDQAETKTPKVTFDLPEAIPFGRYKFYAIANLEITDEQVKTADDLKSISVEWNADNVGDNNAMFGHFSTDNAGVHSQEFDAELLTVNKGNVEMWAWVRRCVSKVTVAFDGRRLNPNVTIYLKSVQIKDIPHDCFIGKENTPDDKVELIPDGETIVYEDGNDYNNWQATVTKGNPIYGAMGRVFSVDGSDGKPQALSYKDQIFYQHGENVPALYFFENLQGEGKEGTVTDKRQDVNGENKDVSYPDGNNGNVADGFKDGKEHGTYIEVKAYYVNTGSGSSGAGDIIYRFMLGQDDRIDYNAKRNHHYKLTMSFNGNANDVDWHIVYEQPDVSFPRPYYISYLYNHEMLCPVTVNAGSSEIEYVKASIVSNAWAPLNPGELKYWKAIDQPTVYPENGFLSLHETTETTILGSKPFTLTANKTYYDTSPKRGERTYQDFSDGAHTTIGANESDVYYVKKRVDKDGNNIYELSLPMYTRAKQLIKQTAYTGNNPYVAYQRGAQVELEIKLKSGQTIKPEKPLEIIQVRRVVNPKGIYRKWDSTKKFHVNLKYQEGEESTTFKSLESLSGPWKAYVVRASDDNPGLGTEDAHGMITFDGQDKIFHSTNKNDSDTIYGENGSQIDFDILFSGSCSSDKVSRHAVIRVEYHNYTCYHLIFIRQGNAPVKLLENGVKWHNTNMISKTKEAETPIDEGSLFQFGNWEWPIASSSNVNKGKTNWVNVVPDDFSNNGGNNLTIVGQAGTYSWNYWKENGLANYENSFSDPTATTGGRVASFQDYARLYKASNVEQGYGVLYGDEASETQGDLKSAYGYISGGSGLYGMRGCFVYNSTTGVNVFFPIGNSGYGHRKNNGSGWPVNTAGLLRYSCNPRWGYFPETVEGQSDGFKGVYPQAVNDCPLFYDVFMRPGAIYWFKENCLDTKDTFVVNGVKDSDVANAIAWDFNYFTFDFYGLARTNLGNGEDACFIRCVSD